MKRITNSLALLLLGICCKAQTEGFAYKAILDSVKEAGFYNIEILPPVNVHCKTDYSDIRIVNGQGKWVPHLLRLPANEGTSHAVLMEMPFVSKTSSETAVTCVVKNREPLVSTIELVMKNTSAQRSCSISGSFNGTDWFIINDSIMLQESAIIEGDKTKCRLNFPPSSYYFFKIVVDSKKTDPVNIIGIGVYIKVFDTIQKGQTNPLIENPNCTIVQKDSAKKSYILVTQSDNYQFEWLVLQVSGVKYFNRQVDVFVPQGDNHSMANPGQWIKTFTISNNSTLQYDLPHTKAKVFYLVVQNDDNLPLQVLSVKTALQYRVLTAYLEKGERYQLYMGNPKADAPIYDLAQLQNKLPRNIPILGASIPAQVKPLREGPMVAPKKNNRYILWGSIGAALLALLYFTAKLLKEVNKQKGLEQEQ